MSDDDIDHDAQLNDILADAQEYKAELKAAEAKIALLRGALERIVSACSDLSPSATLTGIEDIARAALAAARATATPGLDPVEAAMAIPCPACKVPPFQDCHWLTNGQSICITRVKEGDRARIRALLTPTPEPRK